jgi:Family of unknown function (DUF5691)
MDTLAAMALVGTAQQASKDIGTATPIDTLTAGFSEQEMERRLLLAAGAWAIYRQAGKAPGHLPTVPEPAPPETLHPCSPAIARLVEDMLAGTHDDLLPEALEHMEKAGLQLPPELLPTALNAQSSRLRAVLAPVLGERGWWLSQFNPAWSWVNRRLPARGYALPTGAEITWQEGTPEQRGEILRRLRAIDAAKARQWLEAAWKQEKAQFRAEALEIFSTGLSADDESFLEEALNDRSAKVCEIAASLLARIPTSALAARMRSRANELLGYAKGKLTVTPPAAIDKQWQRDGIAARPPQGTGERAWWLAQVIERVPPAHWEERFAAPPAKLIASVRPKEWEQTLIEGWSQAAIRFNNARWILALWDWWYQRRYDTCPEQLRRDLISLMPRHEAENRVQEQLINYKSSKNAGWEDLLSALSAPWSKEFGDAYLAELRNYLGKVAGEAQSSYPWLTSVTIATTALPPTCFATALKTWKLPESSKANTHWHVQRWHEQINTFIEALHIRQRLIEEIA